MKFTDFLKLLPAILVSAGIIALWYDDFIGIIIILYFFWITLPALIAAIVFFILSLKRETVGQKIIVYYGMFNFLLLAAYLVFGAPQQRCSPDIMERHYEKHANELDELCRYTADALDDSCGVTLEWSHGRLSTLHIEKDGERDCFCNEEALDKQDSLMQEVGLSHEELAGIRKRLKHAGCIGIDVSRNTPNTTAVWFRCVGLCRYEFLINDTALTDEERTAAMSDEQLIPYNERVVFRFLGGAIGPQTFGKAKEVYLGKHKPDAEQRD